MKTKTILFFDMDGVLANFDKKIDEMGDIKAMFEPNFFRTLEPMENGLNETIAELQKTYTVKILSKACVKRNDKRFVGQMVDKVNWLKYYVPCIDELNIIIQAADECKGDIIKLYSDYECILIDDYSKNLADWTFAGGIGIKKAKRVKNKRAFKQILSLSELVEEGI